MLPRDSFEVIIVDNASPTPVADLHERFPRARFLTLRENLGFAGGNLVALRHARGTHLALLNPDAIPSPTWLSEILEPLSNPEIGVVGSKILYPGTSVLQHAGGILFPNGRSEHRGRGELDRGQFDAPCDVDYVCGAALAVRRDVIDRVGFLSPAYFPAYYEETELCVRARRAGFRVTYAPKAVVQHHERVASGGERTAAYLQHYHQNRLRFVLRNYSARDLVRRFLPWELQYLAAGCSEKERRICFGAYLRAWRRHASAPDHPFGRDVVVSDSWDGASA